MNDLARSQRLIRWFLFRKFVFRLFSLNGSTQLAVLFRNGMPSDGSDPTEHLSVDFMN